MNPIADVGVKYFGKIWCGSWPSEGQSSEEHSWPGEGQSRKREKNDCWTYKSNLGPVKYFGKIWCVSWPSEGQSSEERADQVKWRAIKKEEKIIAGTGSQTQDVNPVKTNMPNHISMFSPRLLFCTLGVSDFFVNLLLNTTIGFLIYKKF